MKRTLAVSAATAALLVLGGAGVALGQTTPSTSCGAATAALVASQQKGALSQAQVDKLKADQTVLDSAVVAAQKLVDGFVLPVPVGGKTLEQLTSDLTNAKIKAGVGNDALKKAIDEDALIDTQTLALQGRADVACKGADGSTVTVTPAPPAPIVVTIPSAINTGYSL